MNIGGKDLQREVRMLLPGKFQPRHREGIGLLAGRAAKHPEPQRLPVRSALMSLQQFRKHLFLQQIERRRVAEEIRDANEKIARQGFDFRRVRVQIADVVRQVLELAQHHAPVQSPVDGGGLIRAEIGAAGALHHRQHFLEIISRFEQFILLRRGFPRSRHVGMAGQPFQFTRHPGRR